MIGRIAVEIAARCSSTYPATFHSRVLPREVRPLGDEFGLTRIGVNRVTILPGKESSLRHHHSREDELVYVLEGELVLHTDAGEEILRAGMFAGFKAGNGNGHHMFNRSQAPAVYLVMSNRDPDDSALYSDEDLAVSKGPDGKLRYTRTDGGPLGVDSPAGS